MWYETLLKLFLAILLSGIIGYEREHKNRPAGLRTHVLVCVGAAIVQVTSLEFYGQVMGNYASDPFRLGAQVISGIDFWEQVPLLKREIVSKVLPQQQASGRSHVLELR